MSELWNRLGTSVPIDQTARSVVRRGTRYESEVDSTFVRSREPLPIITNPAFHSTETDFRGWEMGRLTITGKSPLPSTSKGVAWVVRCVCGWYEYRRSSSLRKMWPQDAMCSACDHLENLKRGKR